MARFQGTPENYLSTIKSRFPDFPTSTDTLIFEWLWQSGGKAGDLLLTDVYSNYQQLTEPTNFHRELARLAQGLKNRQTSKPDDETICLATLLELDLKPLFTMSGQRRMKYIFERVEKIRPAIVFAEGERIQEEGWRWAPCSFLKAERHPREPGYHGRCFWAERTENGLIVDFDGFLLPNRSIRETSTVAIENRCYRLQFSTENEISVEGEGLAVIHELRLVDLEDEDFFTKAILVNLYENRKGVQYTRFLCVGKLLRENEKSREAIKVTKASSTKWCVG